MKTFKDFGIEIPYRRTSGNVKTFCPKCRATRHNKSDRSLSVSIDKGVWNCHYCGWSGTLGEGKARPEDMGLSAKPRKEYRKPKPRPLTALSRKLVAWFNSRGISEWVLEKLRISEGLHFIPQAGKEMNTVQFCYYLNGELVNVKYRTGNKLFTLEQGAELIPYNIDNIADKKTCIITEGEMDTLSFVEIGKLNCVSVPNGANSNLSYLDDFVDGWFEDKETIYIAVDTDSKGLMLRDELVRRFGSERCKIVTYGEGCKDANEHLQKYGKESLQRCLDAARDVKVDGVFTLPDYEEALDALYRNGPQKGFGTGHENFDHLCSFETKRLCVVTGIPGCVTGDTLVTMADGSHKPIAEVNVGDEVACHDDCWCPTTAPVVTKWKSGVKEVFKLTTRRGYAVEASADHRFLQPDGSYKRLGDLRVGDFVALEKPVQRIGEEMNPDILTLAAYWIADGHKNFGSYSITKADPLIVGELKAICERNHLTLSNNTALEYIVGTVRPINCSRKRYIQSTSFCLRQKGMGWEDSVKTAEARYKERKSRPTSKFNPMEELRKLGIGNASSATVRVPEKVFTLTDAQIGLFLNRLFAGDGYVQPKGVGYCSKSRDLCFDIITLLRQLGILGSLYLKNVHYNGEIRPYYVVDVGTAADVKKFAQKVGIFNKQKALGQVLATKKAGGHTSDIVPHSFVEELACGEKMYKKYVGVNIHRNDPTRRHGRFAVQRCALFDRNIDLCGRLDFVWQEITSIEPMGAKETFDLEVAKWHNYAVNGLCGHNSGKSEVIDELCVRFNLLYDFKVGYFSPENIPLEYHARKLIEKLTGKTLKPDDGKGYCITPAEYKTAKEYVTDNFYHILPEDEYTIDNILGKAKYLVRKYGIRILVIDPFNRIVSGQNSRETETQYISRVLDGLTNFAVQNDVLVFLMAHPRKISKAENGGIPTLYDINGSANFFNKADFGIVVHRNREENYTLVRVEKVKFRHLGECGDARFRYNTVNGRYVPIMNANDYNVPMDTTNLITQKLTKGTIQPALGHAADGFGETPEWLRPTTHEETPF